MFKVSVRTLNNPSFMQSLYQLSMSPGIASFAASYNIAKIYSKLEKEARDLHLHYKTAMKDVVDFEKGLETPLEGKEEEMKTALEDFMNTEIEVQRHKVRIEDLANVKTLTPQQIHFLGPVIEEEEKDNVVTFPSEAAQQPS